MGIINPPATWGEVEQFIKDNGLDRDEYFHMDGSMTGDEPVWTNDTWKMPIWVAEGSNEGFYLHVDQVIISTDVTGLATIREKPKNRMLGKFWSIQAAMHAQNLLWHYIHGFPVQVQVQPVWSERQFDDLMARNNFGGNDNAGYREKFKWLLEALKETPPYDRHPHWAKEWVGG